MNVEIERKFLVVGKDWKSAAVSCTELRQGYLPRSSMTVRVRIAGERAFLTMKGKISNLQRDEFEYAIPKEDAELLLDRYCGKPQVRKTRWVIPAENGLRWEVDEFHDENEGLLLAEIELPSASAEFAIPNWIGKDVSHLVRYHNSNLIRHPYCIWTDSEKRGE